MREIKGGITVPRGFKAGGIKCGLKKVKKDLALIYSEVPARATALFTTNRIWAAPLKLTKEHLRDGQAQAIIINSGNANACTGKKGLDDARLMAHLVARNLIIPEKDVLVASTGIIGRPLPMDKISRGIKILTGRIDTPDRSSAAEAILTTDTFPKEKTVKMKLEGKEVFISGMAKGAGMVFPHLATMLCFITTDALITKRALRKALKESVDKSFNNITIDGDMSTNDMVIILANGLAKNEEIGKEGENFQTFQKALDQVTISLARMLVVDGEGTTKFVEVKIKNARSSREAKKAAYSIANSNLVKAALFGEDANWGRIMAALGQAGIKLREETIDIRLGRRIIVKNGQAAKFDKNKIKKIISGTDIQLAVDLKLGKEEATVWTTDLSEEYVRINSRYST